MRMCQQQEPLCPPVQEPVCLATLLLLLLLQCRMPWQGEAKRVWDAMDSATRYQPTASAACSLRRHWPLGTIHNTCSVHHHC
mmetsp:Transcript_14376/g.38953  ORF Transcript_14376/g.38953 Transcript_14376/m.38953 type:complete len:82 (+) Transcript_14376:241-486(+)